MPVAVPSAAAAAAAAAARGAARGAGAAVLAALLVAAAFALALVAHARANSVFLPAAPRVPFHAVRWRSGDIILTQHAARVLAHARGLAHITVHAGIVWVHPTLGPLVIDADARPADSGLPDVRLQRRPPRDNATALRVVRADDFVRFYRGRVWRRPRTHGAFDERGLAAALAGWAAAVPFDALVDSKQPLLLMGLAASTLAPRLARALVACGGGVTARGRRVRGVYCTEMALWLLHAAGLVDATALPHPHLVSPLIFNSATARVDALALGGAAWGGEEEVVADKEE